MRISSRGLMWAAAAGWVVAAVSFALAGDALGAAGFAAYAASSAMIASGAAERGPLFGWITGGLLAAATLALLLSAIAG